MIFWIDKLVLSSSDWSESSLSLTTSIARWVGTQVNSDTTSKDTRISSGSTDKVLLFVVILPCHYQGNYRKAGAPVVTTITSLYFVPNCLQ